MTIEMRTDCKVCGGDLPSCRHRTFCSTKCRKKYYNDQNKEKMIEWQRERRAKLKGNEK